MRVLPRHPHERLRFATFLALFALSFGVHSAVTRAYSLPVEQSSVVPVGVSQSREAKREMRKTTVPKGSPDFSTAIEERNQLLTHAVTVEFVADKNGGEETISTWTVDLKSHPLWVVFDSTNGRATAVVSEKRIDQYLNEKPFSFPSPRICDVVSRWTDTYGAMRAQTSCISQSGYTYDHLRFVQSLRAALEQGRTTLRYTLTYVPATIQSQSDAGEIEELTLLSTGRSTFVGSGLGRKANVRMALNEKVHNVLVPAGETFSFNKILGPAVTTGNGWHMALTIFDGGELRPAPGGGICQASTTVFRAALRAGLPIVKQKSHSLYVTYYEKYGVGLDATVFPGSQDMVFENNTGGPLLLQAYNEGDEAYVNIYGKDDGRSVTLEGPYFASTAKEGDKVRSNEILWKRTVESAGQEPIQSSFVARYNKGMPKSLTKTWTAATETTRGTPMHAAAEQEVANIE